MCYVGTRVSLSTDENLMLAYGRGDVKAFETLLHRHKRGVYVFLLRSVRTPAIADELVQEVFVKLIRSAPTYQPQALFRTWLYTLSRNTLLDYKRRLTSHVQETSYPEETTPVPTTETNSILQEEVLDQKMRNVALQRALEELPEEQREVVLLREYSEMPFEQIAQIVGASVGTVKSRMRYALDHLRNALAHDRQRGAL